MICNLCSNRLLSSTQSRVLTSETDLSTLTFLRGPQKTDVPSHPVVCKPCSEKIRLVASIQSQVQNPNRNTELDEVDIEEMNQMSAFYAENSDSDPEYDPASQERLQKKITTSRPNEMSDDIPYLMCQLCSSSLRRVASLRRHYITQHHYDPALAELLENGDSSHWEQDGPLDCQECSEEFSSKHLLIRHALHSHTGDFQTTFKCSRCEKAYRYERDLKIHQERLCSGILGSNQDCSHCGKSYNVINLQTHVSFAHKCRFCDKILANRLEKCCHMREEHANELKFECKECKQSFESDIYLKRHQKNKHDIHVITCPRPNCSEVFVKGSLKMKKHLKNYHSPENEALLDSYKYACPECGKKLRTDSHLRSHLRNKHNPEKKMVECPFCDHKLPLQRRCDLYRYHIKQNHPDQKEEIARYELRLQKWKEDFRLRARVQCFLCQYSASKMSNLPRHYAEMHDYDKNLAEKNDIDPDHPDGALCPECGEHFNNRHSQIRHLLKVHSKSSGEQCLYCSNRYHRLEEHIDHLHQEEKAKTSQLCRRCQPEQRFASFDDLLRHTRSYHRKKPEPTVAPVIDKEVKIKRKLHKDRLCENCGKTVPSAFMARHRSECPRTLVEENRSKRYVPVHLSGICPFCDLKFSDLLGHIRHAHAKEQASKEVGQTRKTICSLCQEKFGSVRELVTHRQLHPTFKKHKCTKCKAEFASVNEVRSHRKEQCPKNKKAKKRGEAPPTNTLTLLQQMADGVDVETMVAPKVKTLEYEGRGTVTCHMCPRSFTLKSLLRRHYISQHEYDPKAIGNTNLQGAKEAVQCQECNQSLPGLHERIKHQLDFHATVSGLICPYCSRKFNHLDAHANKYHLLEMQSPIQTCSTCKHNFSSYEDLKEHRQLHEGGNKRVVEIPMTLNLAQSESVSLHSRVGAHPEIGNRGGIKCQLCNAFKLRKDHLKLHYIKHHGYEPKSTKGSETVPGDEVSNMSVGQVISCSTCLEFFANNNMLIQHLLKEHSQYSGQICPYCKGHFPERFIDLQAHVTAKHIDQLTGYNVVNECKVCKNKFTGYAELRDHVQGHGDNYRDPYGNPEIYKENSKKKKRANGKLITMEARSEQEPSTFMDAQDDNAHDVSFPSGLLEDIIETCPDPEAQTEKMGPPDFLERNTDTILSNPGVMAEEPNRDELFDL